jgi:hypothetical protein
MSISLRCERDQDGSPRAHFDDDAYEALAALLEDEFFDNPVLITYWLSVAKMVITQDKNSYFYDTDSYSIAMENGTAVIDYYLIDAADAITMPLLDFVLVMSKWQAVLIEDLPEPMKNLMNGVAASDIETSKKHYSYAIGELAANPQLLADGDELLLDVVVYDLLRWNLKEDAIRWLQLIFDLNDRFPSGFTGENIYDLAKPFLDQEMFEQSEECLCRAARWLPFAPEHDQQNYLIAIIDQYVELLKTTNRESQLSKICEEFPDIYRGNRHLISELYKATGLHEEFVTSSEALNVLGGLAQMMGIATDNAGMGSAMNFPGISSRSSVEAKLRASVNKNEDSTKLFDQLMDVKHQLEDGWSRIQRENTDTPELYDLAEEFIEIQLEEIAKVEPGYEENIDTTPPSDNYSAN